MPPSPQELTLILGPPADPRMRALFDRLQESIKAGHSQEAAVCERIQAEYFGDLFRPEAGRPSIMDELLSAVLGLAVRIRRHELRLGRARGAWVPCLTLARRDVEADDGSSLRFPPADDGARDALAAAIGKLLGLDWVPRRCPRWTRRDSSLGRLLRSPWGHRALPTWRGGPILGS